MLDSKFISILYYMTKADQNSIRLSNINKPGSVFMPLILNIIWHQAFVGKLQCRFSRVTCFPFISPYWICEKIITINYDTSGNLTNESSS